mmetsp:Transcript_2612/g.5652  ORF Transcript_2612/g.5652 Transcript_2612/m.5652 type:complete len:411 (-) Transcript_2612:36-1268(-)
MIFSGRFRVAPVRWTYTANLVVRRCCLGSSPETPSSVRKMYCSTATDFSKGSQLQQQRLSSLSASSNTHHVDDRKHSDGKKEYDWKFGIIAAAIAPTVTGHEDRGDGRRRHPHEYYDCIIGFNGKQLPWKSCPEDIRLFVQTTNDQILIVGRRTALQKCNNFQHINHVKYCIVVSASIPSLTELWKQWDDDTNHKKQLINEEVIESVETENKKLSRPFIEMRPRLRLASSLQNALDLARDVLEPRINIDHENTIDDDIEEQGKKTSNPIKTWIGGGQRLYEESILHPNAGLVSLSWMKVPPQNQQLTTFSSDMPDDSDTSGVTPITIARFPHPYTWTESYQLISSKEYDCHPNFSSRSSTTISDDSSSSDMDGGHTTENRTQNVGQEQGSPSSSSLLSVESFTHCMYYRK